MGRAFGESMLLNVTHRLRTIGWGASDPRLRAMWRVLLAVPLLLLTATVAQTLAPATGLTGMARMVATGLIQAGTFAVLLLGWARYIDRRRISDYGFALSGSWIATLGLTFAAVVIAQSVWYAFGTALGWTTVEMALAAPQGSLALALGAAFVAIAVNVWVQDTVYCRVVLQNAAEGLHARDVAPRFALIGGWLVSILYIVEIHSGSLLRPGLIVAGAIFGLLYIQTGELAYPLGFHLGVNFTGGWVFAPASLVGERATVFTVSESLPLFDALSDPAIPQMMLAYLLVVGWLHWRRGSLSLTPAIAQWTLR